MSNLKTGLILVLLLMSGSKALFGRGEPRIIRAISIAGSIGIGAVFALDTQDTVLMQLVVMFAVATAAYFSAAFIQWVRRGEPW